MDDGPDGCATHGLASPRQSLIYVCAKPEWIYFCPDGKLVRLRQASPLPSNNRPFRINLHQLNLFKIPLARLYILWCERPCLSCCEAGTGAVASILSPRIKEAKKMDQREDGPRGRPLGRHRGLLQGRTGGEQSNARFLLQRELGRIKRDLISGA